MSRMPQLVSHDVVYVLRAVKSLATPEELCHIGPGQVIGIKNNQILQMIISGNDSQTFEWVIEHPFQEATSFSDGNGLDSTVLCYPDRGPDRPMDPAT